MDTMVVGQKSEYNKSQTLKPFVFLFLIFVIFAATFVLLTKIPGFLPESGVLSLTSINPKTKETSSSEDIAATGESDSAFSEMTEDSPFSAMLEPLYQDPISLSIDTLGINAELIPVTTEDGGYLETPKDWSQVGWYKRGAQAGEWGNLLLNGHYDDNHGRPAAFWQLKNIQLGDKVVVEDKLGRTFSYTVLEKYYIDINDPDRTRVFASNIDKKEITLITCGGIWLPGHGTYSQRLVVRGEILE